MAETAVGRMSSGSAGRGKRVAGQKPRRGRNYSFNASDRRTDGACRNGPPNPCRSRVQIQGCQCVPCPGSRGGRAPEGARDAGDRALSVGPASIPPPSRNRLLARDERPDRRGPRCRCPCRSAPWHIALLGRCPARRGKRESAAPVRRQYSRVCLRRLMLPPEARRGSSRATSTLRRLTLAAPAKDPNSSVTLLVPASSSLRLGGFFPRMWQRCGPKARTASPRFAESGARTTPQPPRARIFRAYGWSTFGSGQ